MISLCWHFYIEFRICETSIVINSLTHSFVVYTLPLAEGWILTIASFVSCLMTSLHLDLLLPIVIWILHYFRSAFATSLYLKLSRPRELGPSILKFNIFIVQLESSWQLEQLQSVSTDHFIKMLYSQLSAEVIGKLSSG